MNRGSVTMRAGDHPNGAAIGPTGRQHSIVAVVLTHNAPRSLRRCLDAIAVQTERPDSVVVVDNASHPPAEVESPAASAVGLQVQLVRSAQNTGPAGGWARGLDEFLATGGGHAWVMDDDMLPEPDCLEHLWQAVADDPDRAFAFPRSREDGGELAVWPSWCGFLISRQIVDAAGLPIVDLFWWAEDTEYLQWRIPETGHPMQVVTDAVVNHDAIRQGGGVPLWKYYYEARNMLYVHLHVKHRVGRYPRSLSKLVARALVRGGGGRLGRLGAIARGLRDGYRGNLGMRFPVEPLHEHER
ncbi:MAG: glycosyltransferase [Acidimicrobiales bacterium]